jgi:hypothetical protein
LRSSSGSGVDLVLVFAFTQSEDLEEDEFDDWFDELDADEETEPARSARGDFACSTSPEQGTATCCSRCASREPGGWAAS